MQFVVEYVKARYLDSYVPLVIPFPIGGEGNSNSVIASDYTITPATVNLVSVATNVSSVYPFFFGPQEPGVYNYNALDMYITFTEVHPAIIGETIALSGFNNIATDIRFTAEQAAYFDLNKTWSVTQNLIDPGPSQYPNTLRIRMAVDSSDWAVVNDENGQPIYPYDADPATWVYVFGS